MTVQLRRRVPIQTHCRIAFSVRDYNVGWIAVLSHLLPFNFVEIEILVTQTCKKPAVDRLIDGARCHARVNDMQQDYTRVARIGQVNGLTDRPTPCSLCS